VLLVEIIEYRISSVVEQFTKSLNDLAVLSSERDCNIPRKPSFANPDRALDF